DGGTRPDPSAGRNERLRHQECRQGRVICHDFQGRDPVRADGPRPAGHPDRISVAGDLAAATHDGSLDCPRTDLASQAKRAGLTWPAASPKEGAECTQGGMNEKVLSVR